MTDAEEQTIELLKEIKEILRQILAGLKGTGTIESP